MKLVRTYTPGLTPLAEFERELNRFFGRPLAGLSGFAGLPANTTPDAIASPATDVREEDRQLVVTVELPGIRKEDVHVSIEDGVLTITGERQAEKETNEGRFHRRERFVGRFGRQFELGIPVDANAVKASFKDGVLTVTVPKSEVAKAKAIQVTTE